MRTFPHRGPTRLSRAVLGASVVLALAAAAAWTGRAVAAGAREARTAEAGTAAKPNVLFIAADDLNDWIGALGGYPAGVQTPNMDRLARRGVLFTRAYCAAPACNPSRAALLTGVRPSTSGVYHNNQPWRPVLKDAVTLPQHFMANGYEVVGGGKIFHNSFNDRASWQTWWTERGSPEPPNRPVNGIPRTAHFDWGPLDAKDEEMGDTRVVSQAAAYLEKRHEKPFFLAVGLIKPHLPWYVPRPYFDRYPLEKIVLPKVKGDDLADVPEAGRRVAKPEGDHRKVLEAKQWEKAVQGYLAAITYADGQIGRLLDALDRSPHAKNTVIVFWGDHGWHLGEKEHWRKFALWEEATRVPLVISAPGVTGAEKSCGRTVNLLDLYPTLAELCGLPEKKGLEGRSLVPLLKDPARAWDHPTLTTHGRNNHAVRSERWRYIRYADGSEELYDHQTDPMEWTNLARDAAHDKVKKELAAHLPTVNAPDAPRRQGAGDGEGGGARRPAARARQNQRNP